MRHPPASPRTSRSFARAVLLLVLATMPLGNAITTYLNASVGRVVLHLITEQFKRLLSA